jgi:hypothetical protein
MMATWGFYPRDKIIRLQGYSLLKKEGFLQVVPIIGFM